jgi:hypothetical protein
MAKVFAAVAAVAVALVSLTGSGAARGHGTHASRVSVMRNLSFEFVGQFQNSPAGVTPATHIHYGYLSYIRGLSAFTGEPGDESTAFFTFFANAATLRVIVDGPLRIITRVGKLTIYRDPSTNGDFANPDTFRDGTAVVVAGFRQQVVSNTVTGSFTTFHQATITTTRPFPVGGRELQLGVVGEAFRISFNGQGNMPGPPSGYFGGYGVSG